jgi:predicted small lipoprotein YifL
MNNNSFYRIFTIVLLAVLSLGALSGCGVKLPEGFDEAEVKAAAENVIELLNQRDAESLIALMTEEMKAVLTDDTQAQIFALLDDSGAFQEIADLKMGGSTQDGITYAAVAAKAKYENREITYTISFDEEMKLAGLYLK